ncbi:MAG: pilus assembly PilX N-terminal domain-containing protein [Candidatus Omnitrophica bacterium]|nr:pilus assembly PilX N-terminal domain-containing protein [Candidatus Omnitrophota bacterium]
MYLFTRTHIRLLSSNRGMALMLVVVFVAMSTMIAGISMSMSVNEIKNVQHVVDSTAALYLAEAGIQRALYEVNQLDKAHNLPTADYAIEGFKLDAVGEVGDNFLGDNAIDVMIKPEAASFIVESSALVRSATKTIFVTISKENAGPSIFDYVYFMNNLGTFYGNGILARGDIRSNGPFYFDENPTVNGEIYASGEIDTDDGDIRGTASYEQDGEFPYQHPFSTELPMPNLSDLTKYEEMALANNASISVGGTVIVDGVFGDDGDECGNIILIGTVQNPIEVYGPVVIRGDVIVKGKIMGHGTIYSGRNIYVADNTTYKNSPGTALPNEEAMDTWYENNMDEDIICYAARENIILGDYTSTTGGEWTADTVLFNKGDEDVGEDGIPGTDDDYENDGEFQAEYEDLDGDGIMDDNYGWSDVQTSVPITEFAYCPEDIEGFGDIATNDIGSIEGVLFTNHAIAGEVKNLTVFGALLAKDEAICYDNSLNLFYDLRLHSRFMTTNADWFIQLGLPSDQVWRITEWRE